jgi:Zn finger protein HypA/HybF involved in hydrogenase expression
VSISEERFSEAVDNSEGFCTECNDFTHGSSEPDAENYKCPECKKNTVFGAEQALILGLIDVEVE